jgi:hypothetical protein
MAIYIQIRKTAEDDDSVTYEFGPSDRIVGSVRVDRSSGQFSLISIDEESRQEFYFPRVCRALERHLKDGAFPLTTCYAA